MEDFKQEIDELKRIAESPMFYLLEHFKNILCKVDLAAENAIQKSNENEAINAAYLSMNRRLIIDKIEAYENECYINLKTKIHESFNITDKIELINEKFKDYNRNLNNYTNEANKILLTQLIDGQMFHLNSQLFMNKFMIFIENNNMNTQNSSCFGWLIIVNNEYFSKECISYIIEVLTHEMLRAWYLARRIQESFSKSEPIIELNTYDISRLDTIDLSKENFQKLNNECFKDCSSLRVINLEKNQINEIEPNAFCGLAELTELILYDNKLTKLNPALFKGLKQLHFIDLVKNHISEIHPFTFSHLTKLVDINLADNKIKSLDAKLFNGLKYLNRINLSNNLLDSLHPKIFHGLNNLIIIELGNNKLTSIQTDIFNGLSSLSSVGLRDNKLNLLEPTAFKGLENLVKIDLGFNRLGSRRRIKCF